MASVEGASQSPKVDYVYKEANVVHVLESLCFNCNNQGETRLYVTSIPFFKQIAVTSFNCEICGYRDNSVLPISELGEGHTTYKLTIDPATQDDNVVFQSLSRTVIRSETCHIEIPELGFEIEGKRAEVNTVEGMLLNAYESLEVDQKNRKHLQPEHYERINTLLEQLELMKNGVEKFTFIVKDPAGNSHISNPDAPNKDEHCQVTVRPRTRAETIALGYSPDDPTFDENKAKMEKETLIRKGIEYLTKKQARAMRSVKGGMKLTNRVDELKPARGEGYKAGGSKAALKTMSQILLQKKDLSFDELAEQNRLQSVKFPGVCNECGRGNETRMCMFDIPYFRNTLIMCTDCDYCGNRSSEIKPGGGIAPQGMCMELKVSCVDDLTRDVLKSDFATIKFPEIGLEMCDGTMGGKFTTVEGILNDILSHLGKSQPYYDGDSTEEETRARYNAVIKRIEGLLDLEEEFTFVLDDPAGNSFIEGRVNGVPDTDPAEDIAITITRYDRSDEHNDLLGITGMVTEDYYTQPIAEDDDEDDDDDEDYDDDDEEDDDDSEEEAEQEAE